MLKLVKKTLYQIRKEQPEIIPILSSLTMGIGGMMQGELLAKDLSIKTQRDTRIFIAYDQKNKIVGWTFMFPGLLNKEGKQFRHRAYFFTDPSKRKMGIGSFLMESMLKWIKRNQRELYVFPWDERSRNFFSKWKNNKFVRTSLESIWENIDSREMETVQLYKNKRKKK